MLHQALIGLVSVYESTSAQLWGSVDSAGPESLFPQKVKLNINLTSVLEKKSLQIQER